MLLLEHLMHVLARSSEGDDLRQGGDGAGWDQHRLYSCAWKEITSEFPTLQGVINALILADQYATALETESKSVFCISTELWMPDFCLVGFCRTMPEVKP